MPVLRGTFLAARPRPVTFKSGRLAGQTRTAYQLALVPRNDPHSFPMVMDTDEDTFNNLNFAAGDMVDVRYVENVLDNQMAISVTAVPV